MPLTPDRQVPGTELLARPDVQERMQHEDDVVYVVDPETDEYTHVRPGGTYHVKPQTEIDVAPRTDRGVREEGVR